MKSIKYKLVALFLVGSCIPAFAQNSNPASTKPNQSTPPATTATPTNENVSTNSNTNAPTRTDSVATIPKDGTSITTAPGTKKEKAAPKSKPSNKKKTNPNQ